MPIYERLSAVVSFTLIGLALYFLIDLPTRIIELSVLGWPITLVASQRLLMAVLLGGLAFTGAGAIVRAHPQRRTSYTVPFWVNATLLVILATLILAQLGSSLAWAVGLIVVGILLWVTMLVEYYIIDAKGPIFQLAQLGSQWISYALMLAYAIFMYQAPVDTFVRTGSLSILAILLALSIMKLYATEKNNSALISLAIGLGIGQLSWILHFWPISVIGLGLLTALIFYGFCGTSIAYMQQRLTPRVIAEYGIVSLVGLFVILWYS